MKISKRLIDLRTTKNISRYELSNMSGVSSSYLSDIEHAVSCPSVDKLEQILTALGCSLSEFFNEDPTQMYLSENEQSILRTYRTLTHSQQEMVARMIDEFSKSNQP